MIDMVLTSLRRIVVALMLMLMQLLTCGTGLAGDWPMWRYDAGRTAASPERLPETLHLQWARQYAPRRQAWDDPLNLDLMTYDRLLEPIVMGDRLFLGFNDTDKIAAVDVRSGAVLWEFFTDGPVRMPLAAADGRVYASSDDGCLYCLDATDGHLLWRFRGGPGNRMAIGNQRLISAWPSRGGPVLRDGNVYFASSIWPFMGVFICALDAQTGEVVWLNDETGAQYIVQPHSAPSFAGVGPQGALVATRDALIVPGGRSVPAVFDRLSGRMRYFEINAGGKGTGGSFVAASDETYFVHTRFKGTRAFTISTGLKTAFLPNEPVLTPELVYSAELKDNQPVVRAWGLDEKMVWEIAADGRGELILAGNTLYAAGVIPAAEPGAPDTNPAPVQATLTAIRLAEGDPRALPEVMWTRPVPGQIERLIAAAGHLFAVTLDGRLMAFGGGVVENAPELLSWLSPLQPEDTAKQSAAALLASGDAHGYALWIGAADEALCQAMAAGSPFVELTFVDPDASRVAALRQRWDQAGIYGKVTAHAVHPADLMAPPYVANMVFVGREWSAELAGNPKQLSALYETVRPYGGVMQLLADPAAVPELQKQVIAASLEKADVTSSADRVIIRRVGALPGAADWTHQHGNIANTIKSDDQRVKLPLGILWFGGNSNTDILPRHGHGPSEQVVGGRLIIQGMNSLSARDVYTGRVLWKREFADLGTHNVYFDETYRDTPLDPAYNQIHIPGANARGTNYVVTTDRIYIVEGSLCHVLDPATGETLLDIALPQDDPANPLEWGFIGVYDDVLIGGVGFASYQKQLDLSAQDVDGEVTQKRAVFGSRSLERAASRALVGFDRYSGQVLWNVRAKHSFWHNGIVAGQGRVYALDRNPRQIEDALKRRGRPIPATYRIAAFDAKTGDVVWETAEGIFGTWLGYSETHDLLLQAGAAASDRLATEVGQGMTVYRGKDGQVAWNKDSLAYAGPCILYNDLIITNANSYSESAGAFFLRDGSQKMTVNPLTGLLQPWKITRAYGCNNILASENLLTFRSGSAGFYDLLTESGTGNLGGFKSGCTSNLVVANGVLNAPDYTRTCSCAYQNQTSLALVHMPELEVWTVDNGAVLNTTDGPVRRLGINFGAAGDRRDSQGMVWLEYPVVAGASPNLQIDVEGNARAWQDHPARIQSSQLPWVLASGLEGLQGVRIGLVAEDPETLSTGLPIRDINDDAEEGPDGSVSLTSSDLELVQDDGNQAVGMRFAGVRLAQGGDVRSAHLQLTCDEPSAEPTELILRAELSSDAAAFDNTDRNITGRPLTTARVLWKPEPWNRKGDAGAQQRTPDLAPLIREVISQKDWKPGHAIALVITGRGRRVATASTKDAKASVRLFIDADEVEVEPAVKTPEAPFLVRLYFGVPAGTIRQRRVFDVVVQGQLAHANVTLGGDPESGSTVVVHQLDRVMIGRALDVRLVAKEGEPVLSGIELQRLNE
jgi:outer membrane protein assembly factor BamB